MLPRQRLPAITAQVHAIHPRSRSLAHHTHNKEDGQLLYSSLLKRVVHEPTFHASPRIDARFAWLAGCGRWVLQLGSTQRANSIPRLHLRGQRAAAVPRYHPDRGAAGPKKGIPHIVFGQVASWMPVRRMPRLGIGSVGRNVCPSVAPPPPFSPFPVVFATSSCCDEWCLQPVIVAMSGVCF
jgi:hypothetical protein